MYCESTWLLYKYVHVCSHTCIHAVYIYNIERTCRSLKVCLMKKQWEYSSSSPKLTRLSKVCMYVCTYSIDLCLYSWSSMDGASVGVYCTYVGGGNHGNMHPPLQLQSVWMVGSLGGEWWEQSSIVKKGFGSLTWAPECMQCYGATCTVHTTLTACTGALTCDAASYHPVCAFIYTNTHTCTDHCHVTHERINFNNTTWNNSLWML